MKNTINVFQDGIITDQNPLTIPESAVTSALNATIITGNGNEGLLQNDMGNTLIKDSITGNIMSLSNGFIPLGMKERGGVLYIASYNPSTKEGELGTIPSPVIHYDYKKIKEGPSINRKITDISNSTNSETKISDRIDKSLIYILSDHYFHAGDKFIVILNLDLDSIRLNTNRSYFENGVKKNVNYPQVSYANKRGWFKIKLIAVSSNGEEIEINTAKQQEYWTTESKEISDYWFINSKDLENKQFNLNKTRTSNLFKTFPNIQSGKLAIKFEEELPDKLDWLYNSPSGKNLPQLCFTIKNNKDVEYYAICHGLQYKNGACPITPNKVEISCENFELYTTEYTGNIPTGLKNNGHSLIINTDSSNIITPDYSNSDFIKYTIDEDHSDDELDVAKTNARFSLIDDSESKFLISKRLLFNTSFENYDDNHTDGLFFIKIDDFKKKAIVHVKLYTKDFDNSKNSYVLYDEYDLPEFDPQEQLGKYELISHDVRDQYLDFELPDDYTFELELFKKAENNSNYNSCFLYDGDDAENDYPVLKYVYDNDHKGKYGTYQRMGYYNYDNPWDSSLTYSDMLSNFTSMKTYIFPAVLNSLVGDTSKELTPSIDNSHFIWEGFLSYYYYKSNLYSGVNYLPIIKSSTEPLFGKDLNTLNKALFPTRYEADSDKKASMYQWINSMQQNASSFTNHRGYTANDLKKYCIFNNNLDCLKKQIPWINGSVINAFYTPNKTGQNKNTSDRENFFAAYSWEHFGDSDIIIKQNQSGNDYYKAFKQPLKISYDEYTVHLNKVNRPYGYTDIARYDDSTTKGLIRKGYRGYAIGYVYKSNSDQYIINPFLSFIVGATPGFVYVDKKTKIINLPLIDYKYSIGYLYKNSPKIKFQNFVDTNQPTAVTLNYLQVGDGAGNSSFAYSNYCVTGNDRNFKYSFSMEASNNNNQIDIIKENICPDYISVNEEESNKIFTTYNDVKVLGINKQEMDIYIPIKYNTLDLSTNVYIKSNIEENTDNTITDKYINSSQYNNDTRKYIVSQHILTSVQSNLFIDKSRSLLEYQNKSDYQITTLLKHDGLWINSDSKLIAVGSNVESYDLLESYNFNNYIEDRTNPAKFMKNSFYNEKNNYLTITKDEPVSISRSLNESLEEGLYVFNFNNTENIDITISIDDELKTLYKGQHVIALWVPEGTSINKVSTMFELRGFSNISYGDFTVTPTRAGGSWSDDMNYKKPVNVNGTQYIKNFGLYKVNYSDSSNPASQILANLLNGKSFQNQNITWIEDNNILKNIVFPITFCYKEKDLFGNNLGCLQETYEGFQTLPETSHERFGGAYVLNNNVYASLDEDSIPQDLKTIFGDTFKEVFNSSIKIRQ